MSKKKGYYLWDCWGTKSIFFDLHIAFLDDEYAKRQRAFRRFDDCKKHGIAELENEIKEMQDALEKLKALQMRDVTGRFTVIDDVERLKS